MSLKIDPALLDDGATVARGLLDRAQLAKLRAFYEWCIANPSPRSYTLEAPWGSA